MTKTRTPLQDEINLIDILEILWSGKKKIIASMSVALLFVIALIFILPSSYKVSTPVNLAKQTVFVPYTSLDEALKKNQFNLLIDAENIFEIFTVEFNDYKEIIDVLSNDEYVKQSIEGLGEVDKQVVLVKLAKLFKLTPPLIKGGDWMLSFKWHNASEGSRLLNDAIQQMLINIQISLKNDLRELATVVDLRNVLKLESLRNDLILLQTNHNELQLKKILFLKEQSAIATELQIRSNGLDMKSLSKSSPDGISLSVNSNNIPYYLRGYQSINKEIKLIKNRTKVEGLLISADSYLELLAEIRRVESDSSALELRAASKVLANDGVNDWVTFNFQLNTINPQKNSLLYIVLSLVLGGIIGVIYVLMLNAIRKRKKK